MPVEQLGPYRIIRRLGRGGMGTVYEGVSTETNERVAIKLLATDMGEEEGFRERFEGEIETLRMLRHRNIVRILGFGRREEQLFYAMELVDGSSLEEELRQGRRFTWREVARIGIQVAHALRHAHDRGIIHRDLKPANLLMAPDGSVKLADFGIARLFGNDRLTRPGNVIGTAEYMAPEQASGKPVGPRSDLYSLGAVMYALMAGHPVFRAKSMAEAIDKALREQPLPLRRGAIDVPDELDEIILQLLSKRPEERVANALVLARQLEAMEHALSRVDTTATSLIDRPALEGGASLQGRQPSIEGPAPTSDFQSPPLPESHELGHGPAEGHAAGGVVSGTYSEPEPASPSHLAATQQTSAFDDAPLAKAPAPAEASQPAGDFTMLSEEELDQYRDEQTRSAWSISPHTWALIGALLLVGFGVWYALQPPSADALYETIQSAAERETTGALLGVEEEIEQFIMLYNTDPRLGRVRQWQRDVELVRLQRRFDLRVKGLSETDDLRPVERAYLDAIADRRLNPERSAAKLQALLDLFGRDVEASGPNERTLELARRRLEQLRERIAREAQEQITLLNERLDLADQMSQVDPDEAEAMYRAAIELYGDKPWAAEAVERARTKLNIEE